jgi:hypothetical protein
MAYIYDPSEVKVNWEAGGVTIPISGFSSGSFLSIEFTSSQWNTTEGLDGNVAFTPKNVLSATCTLTLQQGSFGNEVLSQELATQDRNIGELQQRNLTVSDPSGSYNINFANAIIKNQPTITLGKTASDGPREWIFYSPNVTYLETVNEINRGQSTLSSLREQFL